MPTESEIWQRLAEIPDPEVPVITIVELGVVRGIKIENDTATITITPTYTGCPAMMLFNAEIQAALHEMGFREVKIETVFSPAWTTDWLTPEAREKLKKYGIAPPVVPISSTEDLFAPPPVVPCPRCDSKNTSEKSHFGSTACKSLYLCGDCLEPFEYFKHF